MDHPRVGLVLALFAMFGVGQALMGVGFFYVGAAISYVAAFATVIRYRAEVTRLAGASATAKAEMGVISLLVLIELGVPSYLIWEKESAVSRVAPLPGSIAAAPTPAPAGAPVTALMGQDGRSAEACAGSSRNTIKDLTINGPPGVPLELNGANCNDFEGVRITGSQGAVINNSALNSFKGYTYTEAPKPAPDAPDKVETTTRPLQYFLDIYQNNTKIRADQIMAPYLGMRVLFSGTFFDASLRTDTQGVGYEEVAMIVKGDVAEDMVFCDFAPQLKNYVLRLDRGDVMYLSGILKGETMGPVLLTGCEESAEAAALSTNPPATPHPSPKLSKRPKRTPPKTSPG